MSPTAQEKLIELEKINAPTIDQIQQALRFAGIPIPEISERCALVKSLGVAETVSQARSHGRQEYVLRWLLKKFQDEGTRQCTAAWRLLERLVDFVPLRKLSRVLNERRFVVVLRQALEEAVAAMSIVDDSSDTATGSPVKEKAENFASNKRKRNSNVMVHGPMIRTVMQDNKITREWKLAVYETSDRIVQLSKPGSYSREISASEYMKSAIRTSSEEAARILGAWLSLCGTQKPLFAVESDSSLLRPFLEIWDLRIVDSQDATIFSRHCLNQSLLIISAASQPPGRVAQLEELLARNIIIPSKTAYESSKDAQALASLVGEVVSMSPGFAPIIFNFAVRCMQPHGSRPRAADDTAWLQAVVIALKEAVSGNLSEESVIALNNILQLCVERKIALELPLLRLITSQYGLPSGSTNWDLLATIIELDSNSFLIPSKPEDLLEDMLARITKASGEVTWPILVDKVVDRVLSPLMGEFSKARQLTAFLHHWYEQLTEFDKFQRNSHTDIEYFTAWEDEALRLKLKEVLEPSLTNHQIVEIVDWLVGKLNECEGAACVLLDVVIGAVSHEDTRTKLHSTLIEKVLNVLEYTGPDDRYKARLLHLNTLTLDWSSWQNFDNDPMANGNAPLFLKLISSKIEFPDRDHSLVALEAFRYLCAQWSIGAPRLGDDVPAAFRSGAGVETLSSHITAASSHIRRVIDQSEEIRTLVEERWEGRNITIKRGVAWLACAYASCILVEYPQVLDLCMEGQMLTDFLWLASTTKPSSTLHCRDPWLPLSHPGFPSMWMKMLEHDGYVENNKKISQNVINRMIECSTHVNNPIEKSRACNGFVVMCFHHLSLELLSKSNREAVLKAWPPELFDPSLDNKASLLYQMAPLDPAVLSLRAKMFWLPTLYDGINIQELVDLAECIAASGQVPKTELEIFSEIPELILGHVFATIDQPKSLSYIQGVKEALASWLQVNRKTKKVLSYTMIRLAQVVLTVWKTKNSSPDEFSTALKETTEEFLTTFRGLLLSNLQRLLQNPKKLIEDNGERCMSFYSTLDALDAIDIGDIDLANLQANTISTLDPVKEANSELGKRFELFMTEHYPEIFGEPPRKLLKGDVATITGREALRRKVLAMTKGMTEPEKLQLVRDLLEEIEDEDALDKLLALKHVIDSCEDSRTDTQENDGDKTADLSSSYSILATQLQKSNNVRRSWLICEMMEMILREKPRIITQYNIDTTLASMTILCSRDAPHLDPSRASTTYRHLVNIVNAILTCHRLKLQGRFHVVVQTLQSLLNCLFIPSSPNTTGTHTSTTTKGPPLPPWLAASPSTRPPGATHATAYTRLLTLICDPSPSAVSRHSHSSSSVLNSATQKAKLLAGQHMPLVLAAHIHAQLDFSLSQKPEVREALRPGWYAVLDVMTREGRRALGEAMDPGGRAVLAGLVGEWVRFGGGGGY